MLAFLFSEKRSANIPTHNRIHVQIVLVLLKFNKNMFQIRVPDKNELSRGSQPPLFSEVNCYKESWFKS
jgi:hypothetical protein